MNISVINKFLCFKLNGGHIVFCTLNCHCRRESFRNVSVAGYDSCNVIRSRIYKAVSSGISDDGIRGDISLYLNAMLLSIVCKHVVLREAQSLKYRALYRHHKGMAFSSVGNGYIVISYLIKLNLVHRSNHILCESNLLSVSGLVCNDYGICSVVESSDCYLNGYIRIIVLERNRCYFIILLTSDQQKNGECES